MHEIARNSSALCLPVRPDSHGAMMDMISSKNHVNCCMELNSCDFCSSKLLHIIDMMDVIILNNRKYTSHTSNDSCLFAVMDIASSNNM